MLLIYLQGLAPNLLGSAVSWGVYFQVYNTAKRYAAIMPFCAACACEHRSEFFIRFVVFFYLDLSLHCSISLLVPPDSSLRQYTDTQELGAHFNFLCATCAGACARLYI